MRSISSQKDDHFEMHDAATVLCPLYASQEHISCGS